MGWVLAFERHFVGKSQIMIKLLFYLFCENLVLKLRKTTFTIKLGQHNLVKPGGKKNMESSRENDRVPDGGLTSFYGL